MKVNAVFAALLALGLAAGVKAETPPDIIAKPRGDGTLFVDRAGMSLYVSERDGKDKSACTEACAAVWPPLMAGADAVPHAPWSIAIRADGTRQWAYRGMPLYRYAKDAYPGAAFGDGAQDVWRLAFAPLALPPEIGARKTEIGSVLTDTAGFTLYAREGAPDAAQWLPVAAPWVGVTKGDWSVVHHIDGTAQWAFRGNALYRYAGDIKPGDVAGDEVGKGLHAVILEPPAPIPSWVSVAASDAGALFADRSGRTLYAFTGDPRSACDATCKRAFWKPVGGPSGSAPVGDWSVVNGPEETPQWAYRGRPLFTFNADLHPGDIAGLNFHGGKGFQPILRSGRPVQGQAS